MVGKTEYSSVPTAVDLENNSNQKKYTVNRKPGGLVISKALCTLMAIGAILLAVLVGLIVFFLVPRCSEATPQSLTSRNSTINNKDSNYNTNNGAVRDHLSNRGGDSNNVLIQDNDDDTDERLPRSIVPLQYRLQMMPYLNISSTSGRISMTLDVKESTNQIIFHVKDIEIDKQTVKVTSMKTNQAIGITDQSYIEGQKYRIILNENLDVNIMYTLDMLFVGKLGTQLQGFYRASYENYYQNETTYLASTQFSPTDARRAFPCFDEPSFKANFTISIGRAINYSSISNMLLEKSHVEADTPDWVWDDYKETPKMSSYLVAFIVSDLQPYGSTDRLIKVWATKAKSYQTRYAAELAPKILHYLEEYFTIKFPLQKIDIVAVPNFGFSAMENWGLITFRETALLFDEQHSNVEDKRRIATVLGHELGHQWFGNLVTPKWWKDLWLKEGFATYLQYLGVDNAEPLWQIQEEFIISETKRAYDIDALQSARPISTSVKNNQQIRQLFDALSYAKGACIIRMMNSFLGKETFKTGLINFLKKFEYSNADRSDLFNSLTEEAHKNNVLDGSVTVNQIMDTWTEQPGFPVVTAIMDHANKKLILSQKRFLYTNKDNNATWWIPISITTSLNANFHNSSPAVWLKNERMLTIDLNLTDWYLLNINSTGYFVVNYDETNWRLLSSNVMYLPPFIRAQLISDSMDLARANLLDYDIPLRMISNMALHDDFVMYIPTKMAFDKLEYLNNMLTSSPAFGLFEEFQGTIFKQTYRKVDVDSDFAADDYLQQSIRRAVLEWACKKSYSECAIKSHHMFRNWMEKNIVIPSNVRNIVYCTAIREGAKAEWDFAYEMYLRSYSVSEKNVLLDALGCTNKKWILSKYLHFLIDDNSTIQIQDADRVFTAVAHNPISNTMAFDFLRANWNQLLQRFGNGFSIVSKMVTSLSRYMNTEYQLTELINFRDDMKGNLGTTNRAFDNVIEKVRGNIDWMKKNYKLIERWFNDHKHNYNLL